MLRYSPRCSPIAMEERLRRWLERERYNTALLVREAATTDLICPQSTRICQLPTEKLLQDPMSNLSDDHSILPVD